MPLDTRRATRSTHVRATAAVAALALLLGATGWLAPTAGAASVGVYATWTSAGSPGAFSGTVGIAVGGFPAATFASTQRSVGTATSATLGAATPFGAVYGSSSGRQYGSFGTSTGNMSAQSTTITFATPTPAAGWGLALGDIDAESVRISATGADGSPVPTSALGFQGGFNYASGGTDVPTWDPSTGTAIGNPCPASPAPPDCDTNGASVWLQPTTPLRTLTLDFTVQGGAPQFQVWMAANSATISGIVTSPPTPQLPAVPLPGAEVTVSLPNGEEIATTVTGPDGSFTLPPVLAGPEYLVTVDPPEGSAGATTSTFTVDTAGGDVNGLTLTLDATAAPVAASTTTTAPARSTTTTSPPVAARSLSFAG